MIGRADRETVERMTETLAHRGPDAAGLQAWPESGLAFGHRRLAIIDLSEAGRQPMQSADGQLVITFNGEIYNYRELRAQLRDRGHEFHTQTDTEVLLAAYAEWGPDCLERLRGMFAFAIADFARREVFLARDRFGIKPLVWARGENCLLFASELRALLASGQVARTPDPQAIWDYLSLGSVPFPATILRDAQALCPGHAMQVSFAGEIQRTWRWWNLHEVTSASRRQNAGLSAETAAEALREQLADATRAHLVADVPVGAFLSGGIDSAAMVGLMSQLVDQPVRTFTVGFEQQHADFSETAAARQTAEHFHADHTEVIVTDAEAAGSFDDLLQALDQPSMDGANTFFVAKAAAEQVKVVLTGLAGDELFAGYPHFRRHRLAARFPRALCAPLGLLPDRFRHNLMLPALTESERLATLRCQMYEREKRRVLNPDFLADFQPAPMARLPEAGLHADLDPIAQVSLYELEGYMARTLLRDGDAMSMAHGLEARPILLDHRLAEFAFALPSACKLAAGQGKAVFLKALGNLLPESVLNRPKRGFELPLLRWLAGPLRDRADAAFASAAARELFTDSFLADARQRLRSPSPRDFRLWPYFVLLEWLAM
jgi:asparagine synthase (glutamine-hydrolysing)